MRRFLRWEAFLIMLVGGFALMAAAGLFLTFRAADNRDEWMNYAHSLEATAAAATMASPTATELGPTVTLAPSSTPVPQPTSTAAPTNTPEPLPTLAPPPTAAPQYGWVTHHVIQTGDENWVYQESQGQDEALIRTKCYASEISATVPLTDVLDFGGTAVFKIYPPITYDDNSGGFQDDGHVEAHVKLSQNDVVVERDFTNDVEIPCLAAGRWKIEITGKYISASGVVIKFNNSGVETNWNGPATDNPWRYFVIGRGQRSTFGWEFYWTTEDRWEIIR